MTAGDFIPGDQAFDEGPDYPVIFGVRFTPAIMGVLFALLGLGGAAALLFYLVLPEWDAYQQLKSQVTQSETELQQQAAIRQQIDTAKKIWSKPSNSGTMYSLCLQMSLPLIR